MKKARLGPFYINPDGPNIDTMTPENYTRARLKNYQVNFNWSRRFINWLRKAKIVNLRYYTLDKDKKSSIYYDVLTHHVFIVYKE